MWCFDSEDQLFLSNVRLSCFKTKFSLYHRSLTYSMEIHIIVIILMSIYDITGFIFSFSLTMETEPHPSAAPVGDTDRQEPLPSPEHVKRPIRVYTGRKRTKNEAYARRRAPSPPQLPPDSPQEPLRPSQPSSSTSSPFQVQEVNLNLARKINIAF